MALPPFFAGVLLALQLAAGDPFQFDYPGQTDASGKVNFTLRANEDLPEFTLVIRTDGKEVVRKSVPGMKGGKALKLVWTQGAGQAKYELEVTGQVEASFAFDIIKQKAQGKVGRLKVRSSRDEIVNGGTAVFETSFTITRYEFRVYDGDGDTITSGTVDNKPVPAGGALTVTWDKNADPFMIFVRGEDEHGRFVEHKLVPWSVEIPHTEINFDSAKWDIKSDESPKLDEAVAVAFHELDALERVNAAVQANIVPKLYIVGFTDTMGKGPYNEALSDSRARAIAQYFHDKGFWAEIFYAGMGERGLRVETSDSVDEVRNRRALYLIGVQDPAPGGQIPSRWKRLSKARPRPANFQLPALPEKWADYRSKRKKGNENEPGPSDPIADAGASGGEGGGGSDPLGGSREPVSMPGDDGPSGIDGEPGAHKKGCAIAVETPAPGAALGVIVLAALARRRRSRQ